MNGETSKPLTMRKVGYWWSEKKNKKLRVNELIHVCRQSGLELIKLDLERPFEEQGPFVAIVHKLSDAIVKAERGDEQSQAVCRAFQEYSNSHPKVAIIDPLPNISKLLDRYKQYKLVEDSELQKHGGVFIPAFVELTTANVSENIAKMKAANVTFPCVCKPSIGHGSSLAHQLCLIFNEEGLKDISPPCVAQKFINHSAVLYKLFIVGNKYFVIERPSLKNFYAGDYKTIFFDSHDISKPHSASSLTELDVNEPKTPLIRPEKERMDHIVRVLCQRLGLTLLGIDVIIDNKTGHYAIIDMNVFPGYDEVENFFQFLRDLILDEILMHETGQSFEFKPVLAHPKWSPDLKLDPCEKFMFDPVVADEEDEASKAVIPYDFKCFCCPISGDCHNTLRDSKECKAGGEQQLNFSSELCVILENAGKKSNDQPFKIETGTDVFCSPDSTQDDSGIETSDSCDEKKKGTILRNVKRQHSRSHQTAITVDEMH